MTAKEYEKLSYLNKLGYWMDETMSHHSPQGTYGAVIKTKLK